MIDKQAEIDKTNMIHCNNPFYAMEMLRNSVNPYLQIHYALTCVL